MRLIQSIYRFLSPKYQTVFLDYRVHATPRYGFGKPPHGQLAEIINRNRTEYADFIDFALTLSDEIQLIKPADKEKEVNLPTWNNGFLPGLDIIAIYAMLAKFNPKKYIEVGSGNSTKVAFKAKKERNLNTEIISIDPMPRAEIDHLADTVIRKPFENVDLELVYQLEENDILFIDNSHRILPNSDSMVFFMEILPRLKKGVIVHIHDIYLPYDYPQFMCDRFYSEQYGLAAFLLANPEKFNTIFPNYFVSEDVELANRLAPIFEHPNLKTVERHGGSYWLQIQ